MNAKEMFFYKGYIVHYERYRHNHDPASPCRWPGKRPGSKASSKYPNIIAFMRYSIGPYISNAAEIAGVSPKEMAAVVEDNGELNQQQLSRLAYQWGCPVEWLASPSLLIVDPQTIQGWYKRDQLETLLRETGGLEIIPNICVDAVRWRLSRCEPATYAGYRAAIRVLTYAKRHPVKKADCVQIGHNGREKIQC